MERIRKDLIGMAARCELEGRHAAAGSGRRLPDRFLLELAPDLPRGTPLDEVCTWYPRMMLIMVLLNLSVLLVPGAKDPQACPGSSPPPFRWLLWLCVWAWFQRIALKIKIRYGNLPQILWYIPDAGSLCGHLPSTQLHFAHLPRHHELLGRHCL